MTQTDVEVPMKANPAQVDATRVEVRSLQQSALHELPHVVIIGGGFAGMKAAVHLNGAPCRVTVIDRSNHHLFQPLLYQVATAGLSPGEIAAPIRQILSKQKNTEVLMGEVISIDTNRQEVRLHDGPVVRYDYLLIATGARHSYFGHDEWEQFAPGLKSISDATRIRREILLAYESAEIESNEQRRSALLTVVIVGAGPTGVEMAGSIAELAHKAMKQDFRNIDPHQTRVLLVEAGPRVLSAFPAELGAAAQRELERLGVEVLTNSKVESIDEDGVVMNGERVPAKTVIWAAGVKASPASEWLKVEGDRAGRVPVNEYLQAKGFENIFVLGDTALTLDEQGNALPGVASVAMQQGIYVARLLRARLGGRSNLPRFHYRDKGSMATIGRAFAIAKIWKFKLSGVFAWLVWLFVHIMYLIGFRNRLLVLTQWAWAYLTYQRGVRLIVDDQPDKPIAPVLQDNRRRVDLEAGGNGLVRKNGIALAESTRAK